MGNQYLVKVSTETMQDSGRKLARRLRPGPPAQPFHLSVADNGTATASKFALSYDQSDLIVPKTTVPAMSLSNLGLGYRRTTARLADHWILRASFRRGGYSIEGSNEA